MALQTSGPISLNDVAGEFDGSTPHSLSEYYGVDDGVPGSGTISLNNFYGKSAAVDPGPDPDPDPEPPQLIFRTTSWGGGPNRFDYASEPSFGGISYTSNYTMSQTGGSTGGVISTGLFTQGIGQLGGSPTPLASNGFSRIVLFPSNATWTPLAYSVISIGIGGNGLTNGGWYVYDPVWSRYQPPGQGGFSNTFYLSSASRVTALFGPATNNDNVGTIGQFMAQCMDAGGAGMGLDFIG